MDDGSTLCERQCFRRAGTSICGRWGGDEFSMRAVSVWSIMASRHLRY